MVGDSVVLTEYEGLDEEASGVPNERWIVEIRANGNIVLGVRIPAPIDCCFIGANGVAYGSSIVEEEGLWIYNLARRVRRPRYAAGLADRGRWKLRLAPVVRSERPARLRVLARRGFTDRKAEPGRVSGGSLAQTSRCTPNGRPTATGCRRPWPTIADVSGWSPSGGILGFDGANAELPGFPYEPEGVVHGNEVRTTRHRAASPGSTRRVWRPKA